MMDKLQNVFTSYTSLFHPNGIISNSQKKSVKILTVEANTGKTKTMTHTVL